MLYLNLIETFWEESMKYVLLYVLGYVVLFSVVWLHEVGHAISERVDAKASFA